MLDSTLVAALAAKASGKPIKTFTVGSRERGREPVGAGTAHRAGARDRAPRAGADGAGAARAGPGAPGRNGPAAGGPGFVVLHAIVEHARREVTVAIGGEGADELFGGYPRYRWLWRSEPDRLTARRPALRGRLYGPALHGGVREAGFVGDLAGRVNGASDDPAIRQLMVLDQLHCLPDDVLVKTDRAGMRVSLEVRTPYLNRELAEFAATVSERIHGRDGGKALLRGLLAQVAPEAAAGARRRLRGTGSRLAPGPLGIGRRPPARARERLHRGLVRPPRGGPARRRASWRDPRRQRCLWPLLAFGLWLDRKRNRDTG